MKPSPPPRPNYDGFLTAQQRAAMDSGDELAMQAADDAAMAEAILASLAEQENLIKHYSNASDAAPVSPGTPATPTTEGKAASTGAGMAELVQIQRDNTERLRGWLHANGFDIIKNRGGGHNDCLLISLLQHATGDYRSEHRSDVAYYREYLMGIDPSIDRNDSLPSMSDAIQLLIEKINADKQAHLRVAFVAPGLEGEPTFHYYGSGSRYAIIFDQSGHFDAVVPRRA